MKKTWVKRENIFYVPFYKQKSKLFFLCIFFLGIIFFIYQAVTISDLPPSWSLESTLEDLRKKHKQMQASLGQKQTDNDSGGGDRDPNTSTDSSIKIIRHATKMIRRWSISYVIARLSRLTYTDTWVGTQYKT
uniref:Uncharacterized protein n=1 Tax=Stomoxys calcitrans TaxID=35570 RepID=A0A1I8QCQ7_STOCA